MSKKEILKRAVERDLTKKLMVEEGNDLVEKYNIEENKLIGNKRTVLGFKKVKPMTFFQWLRQKFDITIGKMQGKFEQMIDKDNNYLNGIESVILSELVKNDVEDTFESIYKYLLEHNEIVELIIEAFRTHLNILRSINRRDLTEQQYATYVDELEEEINDRMRGLTIGSIVMFAHSLLVGEPDYTDFNLTEEQVQTEIMKTQPTETDIDFYKSKILSENNLREEDLTEEQKHAVDIEARRLLDSEKQQVLEEEEGYIQDKAIIQERKKEKALNAMRNEAAEIRGKIIERMKEQIEYRRANAHIPGVREDADEVATEDTERVLDVRGLPTGGRRSKRKSNKRKTRHTKRKHKRHHRTHRKKKRHSK